MKKLGKQYVIPIVVIVLGISWLLNVKNVVPDIDWVWTLALATIGVLTLAAGGLDKLTVVVGPFMILSSVCSVLRQTGRLALDIEIPLLTIALGALMLFVHVAKLPTPGAWKDDVAQED